MSRIVRREYFSTRRIIWLIPIGCLYGYGNRSLETMILDVNTGGEVDRNLGYQRLPWTAGKLITGGSVAGAPRMARPYYATAWMYTGLAMIFENTEPKHQPETSVPYPRGGEAAPRRTKSEEYKRSTRSRATTILDIDIHS